MENASKALLIAGGVLIALIILTLFIRMTDKMSVLQQNQEDITKVEQIAAFNAEYEAFNKKVMYGADVITLINKVEENNKQYSGSTGYQIVVELNGTVVNSSDFLIETKQEKVVFECLGIEYNNYGRVCKIKIQNK